MPSLTRRVFIIGLAALAPALPGTARATPHRYRLDQAQTQVGFGFVLGGAQLRGTMPVQQANILIDPARLDAASVDVILRADAARTGLAFATQAMIGPEVLDVVQYPTIRFRSTRVRLGPGGRISGGAQLHGLLTLRGITRPIVLEANLYRPRGTARGDLTTLSIRLTGSLSRSAYGAAGFADLVTDPVSLDITAVIRAE